MDARRICGPCGPCGRRDVLEKIADARASSLWYSSPFHSASSIGYAFRTLALRSEFSSGIFCLDIYHPPCNRGYRLQGAQRFQTLHRRRRGCTPSQWRFLKNGSSLRFQYQNGPVGWMICFLPPVKQVVASRTQTAERLLKHDLFLKATCLK